MENLLLEVKDLSMNYFGGYKGIECANFSMNKGEILCVLGGRLSGKSSLLRCIAKLESYKGEINYYDVKDISYSFSLDSLKKRWSVYDNLIYPLKIRKIENANDIVLKKAKLYGIENILDKRVNKLSLEEKILTLIARSTIRDCDLYLLDNVLRGLDDEKRKMIFDILAQDIRGKSVIFATDDTFEALYFNSKICVLDNKRFIQCDYKDNLLKYPKMKNVLGYFDEYEFLVEMLNKENDEYFIMYEDKKIIVNKPIDDIYVGKNIILAVYNNNVIESIYFDFETEYRISERIKKDE